MLITYGIVDFSTVQNDYSTYQANPDQFVKVGTNTLFPFFVLTSGVGTTATMEVLDINGTAVQSAISLTVATNEDAKQISYAGATLTDKVCGHYQLKITHGSDVYYSEFFEWSDDLTNYVKITATPEKILVNNYYTVDLSSTTFIQYYATVKEMNGRVIESGGETTEEGVSKNYGDELLKSTINFEHEASLIGNDSSFRYLSMLRPSTIGGTVVFEYKNRQKTIYGIAVEQSENTNFGEKMIIKMTFREESFISNNAE
jgi:hypothetical protein